MKRIYRQGDLFIVEIDDLPKDIKQKNNILAYGEITGHKHQFLDQNTMVYQDENENQFVQVKQDAVLQHEEHDNITIEKGKYRVIQQRELDLLGEVRSVLD